MARRVYLWPLRTWEPASSLRRGPGETLDAVGVASGDTWGHGRGTAVLVVKRDPCFILLRTQSARVALWPLGDAEEPESAGDKSSDGQ